MHVLVTGGTGFVGSHTVAELVRRGHRVRLYVRDPERIPPALEPLGLAALPHVTGDVTDQASVAQAMEGCDAVVHAASVYSLDVRDAGRTLHVNPVGTEAVLAAARDWGLDPVVYVSSYVALFPPGGAVLTGQSPVGQAPGAYYRSKAAAERIARDYQARGTPVTISYPGAVFGPHDPHFGESAQAVRGILAGRMPMIPRGGISVVDVRDLAQAHAAMVEAAHGPRRYMLTGTSMPFSAIIDTLADITGRRIPRVVVPAWTLRPGIRAAGLLQRLLPVRLPVNQEGFNAIVWNPRGDDSPAENDLGFVPRDVRDTLADTAHWIYRQGQITRKQAGKLADTTNA